MSYPVPSETCETLVSPEGGGCGRSATFAYPAMGGGWFSMCDDHAKKHRAYSVTIDDARKGRIPRYAPEAK